MRFVIAIDTKEKIVLLMRTEPEICLRYSDIQDRIEGRSITMNLYLKLYGSRLKLNYEGK